MKINKSIILENFLNNLNKKDHSLIITESTKKQNILDDSFNTIYDEKVFRKLKEIKLAQKEDRQKVQEEENKVANSYNEKDYEPEPVKYFKTIYNNEELKKLENPPKVNVSEPSKNNKKGEEKINI